MANMGTVMTDITHPAPVSRGKEIEMKMTHAELLEAAIARVTEKWPEVDAAQERASMSAWSDYRLATAYSDLSDAEMERCAKMYEGAPGWNAADLGGLAGHDPIA